MKIVTIVGARPQFTTLASTVAHTAKILDA